MIQTRRVTRSCFDLTCPTHHSIREELTQPVFTAMDAFEYPELHDESVPSYNFFRQLAKLMQACGVKDFSWRVG